MDITDLPTKSPTTRSAVTNGSQLLRGVDGRSAEARRYRDLCEGFAAEFGAAGPGEREQALIKQCAAVTVKAEEMQAAIVRGEPVDAEQIVRLTNTQARVLKELGLRKRRAEKPETLRDYVARRHAEGGR